MSLIKIAEEKKLKLRVEQAALEFDCFFQKYMWNGYDDEDDPKFLTPKDFEAIQALSDKIVHMICHIGCPSSVLPMLHSIADRKIKHWQADNNVNEETKMGSVWDKNNQTSKKVLIKLGYFKGRQLKSKNQIHKVRYTDGYYHSKIESRVISGHFRWNNQGYTLSRIATDLLQKYIINSLIE